MIIYKQENMKSLVRYIKEAIEEYRLDAVDVVYDCKPNEIYIQAPESYQESDIQQYIDDLWLPNLPSNEKYAQEFFGKNCDCIYDVYFEYDKFEHISDKIKDSHAYIVEFDSHYATKAQVDDEKLDYFKITNLKYHIKFDRFDMVDVDDDTVHDKLVSLFKTTESSNINEYPIEIVFDENSLEYKK